MNTISWIKVQTPGAGAPVVVDAENGLSKDAITSKIVLGGNTNGATGQLITDRFIRLNARKLELATAAGSLYRFAELFNNFISAILFCPTDVTSAGQLNNVKGRINNIDKRLNYTVDGLAISDSETQIVNFIHSIGANLIMNSQGGDLLQATRAILGLRQRAGFAGVSTYSMNSTSPVDAIAGTCTMVDVQGGAGSIQVNGYVAAINSQLTLSGAVNVENYIAYNAPGVFRPSGTVQNVFGFYVAHASNAGATSNWGFFSRNTNVKSFFNAKLILGGGLTGGLPTNDDPAALLDLNSVTQGLKNVSVTTAQKNAIVPAATSNVLVFDTDLKKLCVWTGAAWETITSI